MIERVQCAIGLAVAVALVVGLALFGVPVLAAP